LQKNSANQNMCIQYQNLQVDSNINVVPCDVNNQNQKWYPDVLITQQSLPTPPTSTYKMIKSYTNNSLGFNINGGSNTNETQIKMFTLSGVDHELWFYETSTSRIISKLGKCIDAWDTTNVNNRWIRINDCNNGNNQKFTIDGSARIHSVSNNNLCIDSYSGNTSGSTLYMSPCHFGSNQQWQLN
jgi:Ricin-type beta-trefoil lectin domain